MSRRKFDFSGYATKNNLKCSDGRVIQRDAFKHQDGAKVPLVWQHLHNDPDNVLGHAYLENREDGVYAYGKFNDTESGRNAKELVKHGDVTFMSIYANGLKQIQSTVMHGVIREVSLVLSGANPGAKIDNINFAHSEGGYEISEEDAIIHTGIKFILEDEFTPPEYLKHEEANKGKTVKEVFDSLTEEQKNVVYFMIGEALEGGDDMEHAYYEGDDDMKRNIFDGTGTDNDKFTLTHDHFQAILADAKECGSFKTAFLAHAESLGYGIEDIDILFPDARTVTPTPEFIKRDTGWVNGIINGAKHTPFSRIKSTAADITADEARARGYVKGAKKKEEVIKLLKRVTGPTTIYKKQKLDRDDIIDITDLDVVAWIRSEMRLMLDEEIARAVLISDGRDAEDPDKINEENIRPIADDDDMYAHQVTLNPNIRGDALIEAILRARPQYKGAGNPTLYTTESVLTDLLLLKDKIGRRLYATEAELASALRVKEIVPVEVMEGRDDLIAIMVNMSDYTLGADKGGQVSMFDDFDIDYNQYKYLLETRCSGCLTKPKSALVFKRNENGIKVTPITPSFSSETNKITVPTRTGVVYLVDDEVVTGTVDVPEGQEVEISAEPDEGYFFPDNITTNWVFENPTDAPEGEEGEEGA